MFHDHTSQTPNHFTNLTIITPSLFSLPSPSKQPLHVLIPGQILQQLLITMRIMRRVIITHMILRELVPPIALSRVPRMPREVIRLVAGLGDIRVGVVVLVGLVHSGIGLVGGLVG